jgi:hypothetical protein
MSKDPVIYTIFCQRFFAILGGLFFFLFCFGIVNLNPFDENYYIWIFLSLGWACLSTLLVLISFWWVFSIKKIILEIVEVNKLIYNSWILSLSIFFVLVLYVTNFLSILTLFGVLTSYVLYRIWL